MKKNRLFGVMTLIVGVVLVFGLAGCGDPEGGPSGGGNGNGSGDTLTLTNAPATDGSAKTIVISIYSETLYTTGSLPQVAIATGNIQNGGNTASLLWYPNYDKNTAYTVFTYYQIADPFSVVAKFKNNVDFTNGSTTLDYNTMEIKTGW